MCGLSRLSVRSLVATLTFFLIAVGTVLLFLREHLGPAPATSATFNLTTLPLRLPSSCINTSSHTQFCQTGTNSFILHRDPFAFGLGLAGML